MSEVTLLPSSDGADLVDLPWTVVDLPPLKTVHVTSAAFPLPPATIPELITAGPREPWVPSPEPD